MPFFWPWKRDDQSPASFEKTLSALSAKISRTNGKLDKLRQRSRRFAGLWTLYSIFAYLLYSIVLVLVVGWDQWGIREYSAVAGGPAVIYGIRLLLVAYYNFRSSKYQAELDQLQKRRDNTIDRLKAATKYNTTQELLKKYGGAPPAKEKTATSTKQAKPQNPQKSMTGFAPPPTANIPGRNVAFLTPAKRNEQSGISGASIMHDHSLPGPSAGDAPSPTTSAEFAPNAFAAVPQYAPGQEGPRWYDRILDVLLGDDETLPRNRLALICRQCRLVNGQASPGTASLEDVGKWRCSACGTMNGEESEASRIMANLRDSSGHNQDVATSPKFSDGESSQPNPLEKSESDSDQDNSDITQYSNASEDYDSDGLASGAHTVKAEMTPRRRSARIREMSEDP